MTKKIIALIALFSVSSLALAGGYRYGNGYVYQQQYNNYNYQQQYQQQYEVNPVVVIGVPVSNLGVPYYWSVGETLREEAIAQKAANIVIASAKKQSVQQPKREIGVSLDFDLISSSTPSSPATSPSNLDAQVAAIFNESCIRCHKPGASRPGIQLFNADGSLYKAPTWREELKRRQTVYDSISGEDGVSQMPKNAEQLDQEKQEIIYAWLREQVNKE